MHTLTCHSHRHTLSHITHTHSYMHTHTVTHSFTHALLSWPGWIRQGMGGPPLAGQVGEVTGVGWTRAAPLGTEFPGCSPAEKRVTESPRLFQAKLTVATAQTLLLGSAPGFRPCPCPCPVPAVPPASRFSSLGLCFLDYKRGDGGASPTVWVRTEWVTLCEH